MDIIITNEEGGAGKCYAKHFSGRFDQYDSIPEIKSNKDKKFEEFLAEFLTNSGQMVRNNLLGSVPSISGEEEYERGQVPAEELQYTLTLGTGQ